MSALWNSEAFHSFQDRLIYSFCFLSHTGAGCLFAVLIPGEIRVSVYSFYNVSDIDVVY